jgi:hypothetical protein
MSWPPVEVSALDVERYFGWLTARIRKASPPLYDDLLRILFETEFVWLLPRDENRAADGLELRNKFERSGGWTLDPAWRRIPCSMLEMMVALSERANFQTDIPIQTWFWTLIENLELEELRHLIIHPQDRAYVDDVLYNLNYRLYRDDGRGGLFPLHWPREDQVGIEIWYQLAAYIDEQHLV